MSRPAAATGALLLLLGAALFAWKALVLDLPVAPSDPQGLWHVELRVTARGSGARGSVRAALPSSGPGQIVFDEHAASDRLLFAIRTEDRERTGVWSGRLRGVHEIVHGFRVQLSEVRPELPEPPVASAPPESVRPLREPSAEFPAQAPEVAERLASLPLPGPDDPVGRLRTVFSFVESEVAAVATGSDDALLCLAAREGSAEGKARLLVTLLRAAQIPARVVRGLRLREDSPPAPAVWAEAWIGGGWIPASPTEGFFATQPADRVVLRRGPGPLLEATSVTALGHRYSALRERLHPSELAAMMVPATPLLGRFSLYRLPVPVQQTLRLLLLLPLGALVVAFARNVIGVPTFGTFMPILIAFALRETALLPGLGMVASVILLGIVSRLVLERLRLLLVPRLSLVLCVVVLGLTGLALLGREVESRNLFTGTLLPIVILTMLIERFSITLSEEGLRPALVRASWSTAVAVAAYPLFRSTLAQHLLFGFPELVLAAMGLLVWIGAYTGYRLSDLIRFRYFAAEAEDGT